MRACDGAEREVAQLLAAMCTCVALLIDRSRVLLLGGFCCLSLLYVSSSYPCSCSPTTSRATTCPVLLTSDVWPVVLVTLFGLSNGYVGTMCMILGPAAVPLAEETAGALMSFFLTCGLAGGAALSFIYPFVI